MRSRARSRLLPCALTLLSYAGLTACAAVPSDILSFEDCCGANPPAPAPTPSASGATVADVAPAGTGSNTDRVIWSDALDNEEVTGALSFRLVQAVRNTDLAQPAQVQNVTSITDAGASLTVDIPVDPDAEPEVRFTIKDPGMGIQDVVLEQAPDPALLMATLPDGRVIHVTLDMTDQNSASAGEQLSWTAYGAWNVATQSGTVQTASFYVTGDETPDGNVPTTGTATFDGFVTGNVTLPDSQNIRSASLQGDASMTVDFASGTIAGGAPNIMAIPLGTVVAGSPPTIGAEQAWNGLTFSGTLASGLNGFSGTTGVSSAPGNSYSLSDSADGFFAGLFYGPAANELGAVWNLSDGVGAASGVLVGQQ